MCEKLIFLVSLILLLVLTGNAIAQIDPATVTNGHVYLFENVGTNVPDDSANNHTANLIGNPKVVAGLNGKALQFNGTSDGIHIPDATTINTSTHQNRTVVVVFNCADVTKSAKQCVYEDGGSTRGLTIYVHAGLVYAAGWNRADYTPQWNPGTFLSAPIESNQWIAVAAVLRGGTAGQADDKFEMWVDGRLVGKGPGGELRSRSDDNGVANVQAQTNFHDGTVNAGHWFEGMIDEVWILNQALTENQLGQWQGKPWPYASGPVPPDGAIHLDTWISLSWKPGQLAVSHDVYLGVNYDDVNNATRDSSVFRGNQTTDFYVAGFPGFAYPEGLVPGTTYYWRIDEVNDADPNSPWKGKVWSFSIPPRKAYNPNPLDGAKFIATDTALTWTGGLNVKLHTVYLGDNLETVTNAAGGLSQAEAKYVPGSLAFDKTYYWRVDEFDGAATHKGDVWSFTTAPEIPITDPNFIGWWKFDEGMGTRALDWSGHGNHGVLNGNPQWISGQLGGALAFDGTGDYVDCGNGASLNITGNITLMCWIKVAAFTKSWETIIAKGDGSYRMSRGAQYGDSVHFGCNGPTGGNLNANTIVTTNTWRHAALVYDGANKIIYIDGVEDARVASTGSITSSTYNLFIAENSQQRGRNLTGLVDDVRIYNKALTPDEVKLAMRGELDLAWNPKPGNGSIPDISEATPLTWSPGDKANQHDVYFGTDEAAVEAADTSDATGVYRGRQSSTSYTPPEGVQWGGGPYYWRIDEVNSDGTISKGRVWAFKVADFRLIDDFESYNAGNDQIWYSWHDGLGYGAPGTPPYFAGNGTGSAVGDENTTSYTEQTIIHGGRQSMPVAYDNNKQGFAKYSEVEFKLAVHRDWTEQNIGELSIWFRGRPASVGSFVEGPVGTYTMTATGADIWNQADQFHYAFKTLTGVGTIEAQVLSVGNTDPWAKAGVMIRETLDAGSKFAAVYITPGNGCRFQARLDTGIAATSDTAVVTPAQTAITAPYWVKLERDAAGNFRGYYSVNGTTWTTMSWNPQNIVMGSNVYVGLALTSHNANATCTAKFSNVRTTGTVGPQWANQDIGIASNAPEPLYVAIANTAGQPAVAVHPDPAAATIVIWTEWVIPLWAFSDKGINLANVDNLAIGLGTRGNMTTPGGSGKMYFDDIRLYRPRTP